MPKTSNVGPVRLRTVTKARSRAGYTSPSRESRSRNADRQRSANAAASSATPTTPVPTSASIQVLWIVEVVVAPEGSEHLETGARQEPVAQERRLAPDREGVVPVRQPAGELPCLLARVSPQDVRLGGGGQRGRAPGRGRHHAGHCEQRQHLPPPRREEERERAGDGEVAGSILAGDEGDRAERDQREVEPSAAAAGDAEAERPEQQDRPQLADAVARDRRVHALELERDRLHVAHDGVVREHEGAQPDAPDEQHHERVQRALEPPERVASGEAHGRDRRPAGRSRARRRGRRSAAGRPRAARRGTRPRRTSRRERPRPARRSAPA